MKHPGIFAFGALLFLLPLFSKTSATVWDLPPIPENGTDALESWIKLDKNLKGMVQSTIKSLMPTILESTSRLNISSQCVKESLQLITGLRNLKTWAFNCKCLA
ncbi:NRF domain-containing protein [Nephila pilipes]|uniref:NRF domain-containing protein n=1 Tax=Nephila pilipes TaxID=299642 RepID=A0A8X6NBT2_NEPPI|nr:NRF domain-containing protein [Nephila pilipes]